MQMQFHPKTINFKVAVKFEPINLCSVSKRVAFTHRKSWTTSVNTFSVPQKLLQFYRTHLKGINYVYIVPLHSHIWSTYFKTEMNEERISRQNEWTRAKENYTFGVSFEWIQTPKGKYITDLFFTFISFNFFPR